MLDRKNSRIIILLIEPIGIEMNFSGAAMNFLNSLLIEPIGIEMW